MVQSEFDICCRDGTAVLILKSAPNYDATLTGVDEENIIASMFLNSIGKFKKYYKINQRVY